MILGPSVRLVTPRKRTSEIGPPLWLNRNSLFRSSEARQRKGTGRETKFKTKDPFQIRSSDESVCASLGVRFSAKEINGPEMTVRNG